MKLEKEMRKGSAQKKANLRREAAKRLMTKRKPAARIFGLNADELIHELEVHQIELEMQNEALREREAALVQSRNQYALLYDFAPVG